MNSKEAINNTVSRLLEELTFIKDNYSKISKGNYPVAYVIHPEIYSYVKYYFSRVDPFAKVYNVTLRLIFGMNFYEDKQLKDTNNHPSYKVFYNEPDVDEYYKTARAML